MSIQECPVTHLRQGLPPLPRRMKSLRLDERGYPVPYFVEWIDGKPDFRVVSDEKRVFCWKFKRCWLCGQELGTIVSAVIGPMCVITGTTSEPFSHFDCCEFSVKACPFLSIPTAERRDANLPEDGFDVGVPLRRNPGCSAIISTKTAYPFRAGDSFLFNIGEPISVAWWAHGLQPGANVRNVYSEGVGQ